MRVGEVIRKLRKQNNNMTQAQLAEKLNVAPTTVASWEQHKNRPLIDKVVMMSELFEVPIEYFYGEFLTSDSYPHPEQESNEKLLTRIKEIAQKYELDLNDPATLDIMDSALDLIKRVKDK